MNFFYSIDHQSCSRQFHQTLPNLGLILCEIDVKSAAWELWKNSSQLRINLRSKDELSSVSIDVRTHWTNPIVLTLDRINPSISWNLLHESYERKNTLVTHLCAFRCLKRAYGLKSFCIWVRNFDFLKKILYFRGSHCSLYQVSFYVNNYFA